MSQDQLQTKGFRLRLKAMNHARIQKLRWLRLFVLKVLLDQRPTPYEHHPNQKKTSILILRTDGKLGDSITSTYLIERLKAQFQNSEITVISDPQFQNLFSPLVHHYISLASRLFPVLHWLMSGGKISRKKYDILISTSHILSPATVFLCRFISARYKVSFLNSDWKMFSHHVSFDLNWDHVTRRYDHTLGLLQTIFSNNQWSSNSELHTKAYSVSHLCSTQPQIKKYIDQIKSKLNVSRICVVNSFAGARLRNFSQATTYGIIDALLKKYSDLAIISIANRGDRDILRQWSSQSSHDMAKKEWHRRWLISEFHSLSDNVGLIQLADLVITPDTSIVHLTCGLNRPLVAVYRQDVGNEKNQQIWAPIGNQFRIVEAP